MGSVGVWVWVFALGIVVALVAALNHHERVPRRIVLTVFAGCAGAALGMASARAVWLYGPPSASGVFAAAFVGAIVIVAIEQLALTPESTRRAIE